MSFVNQQTVPVDSSPYKAQLKQVKKLALVLSKFVYYQEEKTNRPIHRRYIEQFLHQYNTVRVPLPNIIKKIWEKLKKNDSFRILQKQQKSTDESLQSVLKQKLAKKLELKKTYYQENIEAAKSLKSQLTIQKILTAIQEQNVECLGCLKQLEYGKPFPKTTQLSSFVNGKLINKIFQDNVKKKTCALLNNQGGYLFVGQNINRDSVKGLALNDGVQHQLREFVLSTIKNNIFPNTFKIKIDTLKVIQPNSKIAKIILRVALRPNKGENGLYFVKKEVLKYPSVFSCYFLDMNAVGEINDICVLKNPENIYTILIKQNKMKNTEQIVHKFDHVGRNDFMHNLFNQINFQNLGVLQQQQQKKLTNQEPQQKRDQNQFILIIHNQANDKYIHALKNSMKTSQILYKPFLECRNKSMKSMWLIIQNIQLTKLQSRINQLIKNKSYTLVSLSKYLMLENIEKKIDFKQKWQECFNSYQQKFEQRLQSFGVQNKQVNENQQKSYNFYLKFPSYLQCFYIFSYLDNLGVLSKTINPKKYYNTGKNSKKIQFDQLMKLI